MPVLSCPKSRCGWKTDDVKDDTGLKLIEMHLSAEHEKDEKGKKKDTKAKVEKPRRPEITPDMSADRWAYFLARWNSYKTSCGLEGEEVINQLMECMTEVVREDHYRQFSGSEVVTEAEVLEQIKQVAVKKANRAVLRDSLVMIKQERGETVRKFVGRVRALAVVCELTEACTCSKQVSYMEARVKDQVMSGLVDQDIKTAVLSHRLINNWTLDELVLYVESKEAGKLSLGMMSGSASRVDDKKQPPGSASRVDDKKQSKERCKNCNRFHGREKECPAKSLRCFNCDNTGHVSACCRKEKKPARKEAAKVVDTEKEGDTAGAVSTVDSHWICNVSGSDFYENKQDTKYSKHFSSEQR